MRILLTESLIHAAPDGKTEKELNLLQFAFQPPLHPDSHIDEPGYGRIRITKAVGACGLQQTSGTVSLFELRVTTRMGDETMPRIDVW